MNIFNKIYEIMNEYDTLLLEKDNSINENIVNNNIFEKYNKNEYYNSIDDFFKYIFKNININKQEYRIKENKYLNSFNEKSIENEYYYLNSSILLDEYYDNYDNNDNNDDNNDDNNNDNNEDINNNKDINNEDNNNKYYDNNDDNNNKYDDNNNNNETINKFIKNLYKKLILKCHPDKNGNDKLFIKCKEYYENKFLIGLLYICFIIKYQFPELNKIIINKILFEIRVIQEKIIYLKLLLKKI